MNSHILDKLNTNKATLNKKINNINKITDYKNEIQRLLILKFYHLTKKRI